MHQTETTSSYLKTSAHGASPRNDLLQNPKDLVTCDVNMTQLSTYISTIIQVINQHAKLLDAVSFELGSRPVKKDIADMFNCLAHTFPYQEVMRLSGQNADMVVARP